MIWVPASVFGYWLSRFVPMTVHSEHKVVTLSFDGIYFSLIIVLIIAKILAGKTNWDMVADTIMVFILGMMVGRIGGIGVKVRRIKKTHGFV